MTHIRFSPFVLCGAAWLMLGAADTPAQTPAAGQPKNKPPGQRREITWVNPKLPNGPGLTHHVLASKSLGHDVGYVVWTPPSYAAESDKRFPVIYFLHGAGGNEAADSAGFSGWVHKAMERGILPPVLCVFPNGGMSGYRGEVERLIVDELIPQIDQNYRSLARRQSRALAGFSMGGAGSVYLSIMHPELFCAAGSMGGRFRGGAGEVSVAIDKALPIWTEHKFGFFLANGDMDQPDAFKSLVERLGSAGVDHEVLILPQTGHNLGLYYERSAEKLLAFLGQRIAP